MATGGTVGGATPGTTAGVEPVATATALEEAVFTEEGTPIAQSGYSPMVRLPPYPELTNWRPPPPAQNQGRPGLVPRKQGNQEAESFH